jgi:mannosyltransferase
VPESRVGHLAASRISSSFYWSIPVLATLLVGVWGLTSTGLWLDERFTAHAVEEGVYLHAWEAPLIPYYALMWLWTAAGNLTDDWWLRTSSIVSTCIAVACVSVTARRLSTRTAGLVAGLILAMAPDVSRYAQEARAYAVALALVSFATLCLIEATSSPQPRRWWIGYCLGLGLGGLFLPVCFVVLVAHAFLVLSSTSRRDHLKQWLTACLFLTPVVAVQAALIPSFSFMHEKFPPATIGDLPSTVTLVMASPYTGAGAAFALCVGVLALVSREGARWLVAAVLSVLAAWTFSLGPMSWWLPRVFVPLAGLAAVGAGASLGRIRWPRLVAIFALLAVAAAPALVAARQPLARGLDLRLAAGIMSREGLLGDRIPPNAVYEDPTYDPLVWAVSHYLDSDGRFTDVPASGRWWTIETAPACHVLGRWDVGGSTRLTLCS